MEGAILLVVFIEHNQCREEKVEGLILPIEYCQSSFSGYPFPEGGVVRVLYYGVKKVTIILVGLA